MEILYCDFGGTLAPLAIFLYALWLIVLFIGLGESADSYFCPNLAIISKTLRYNTVFLQVNDPYLLSICTCFLQFSSLKYQV